MRRLCNGVFCCCNVFEMQGAIKRGTLRCWYLGAERVIATRGDDQGAKKRLYGYNVVSMAHGFFQAGVG